LAASVTHLIVNCWHTWFISCLERLEISWTSLGVKSNGTEEVCSEEEISGFQPELW